MTTITGSRGIYFVQLCSIRGRLRLEMAGLRFKGRGILTILREQNIIPQNVRTKKDALAIVEQKIEQMKKERSNGA